MPDASHAPLSRHRLPAGIDRPADRRERAEGVSQAFGAVKAQHAMRRTRAQRVADALIRTACTPAFLALHLVWFAGWVAANSGLAGAPFDPFPFGLLTLVLSMEAIVLTILVLISQGRESAIAELREELTLQVNLRIEEEVTKTLQLVTGLYGRLGLTLGDDDQLRGMLQPLDAREIEEELAREMAGDDERAGAIRSAVQRVAGRLRGGATPDGSEAPENPGGEQRSGAER